MGRWNSPRKGGDKHVWEVEFVHHAARRFSLSGRDSPALVGQGSGGYPVRPACYDRLADRPDPPSPSPTDEPTKQWLSLRHCAPPPFAASHRHF